ncbi:MAG: histidinol-phosphate transaminase [Porticoccaceae bacterium]|nr:histidinol-phosphate transaminase [Porticoccaceae bacterium]
MSRYWSDFVASLQPYTPGEQPQIDNLVKLNTNENPYGPSPRVLEAMQALLNEDLRLYPAPNSDRLKSTIAKHFKLDSCQVFVGNGSDEVLAHVFNGFFRQSEPILFPDISYSFYPVFCQLYGIDYRQVALADDFSLRLTDYLQPNGGIIFPNPNSPTGRLVPLDEIRLLLDQNSDSVVVVDEAYIDFGGVSALSLIDDYDNLLVVHTLSKARSLAGMRIGYALGAKALIEGLDRIKNSFNSYPLGHLQVAAAVASFEDVDYFNDICHRVVKARGALIESLEGLDFMVLPSAANFVFVSHTQCDAAQLSIQLRERGVLVRHFQQPRIANFLRITVGSVQQNAFLLGLLKETLAEL